MYRFLLVPLLAFLASSSLLSQQGYEPNNYTHQLELRHDNDFFLLTDRYYSSGLYLTYRHRLENGLFGSSEQLEFRLGQEVYTPAQTQSLNSQLFDRPYVGFTGLLANWSKAYEKSLFQIGWLFGIAGNNSGAGGFQRWYHKAVAISDSPLWIDELNNSLHLNLYSSFTKEWTIMPNPFGIRAAIQPKIAVGSRDIFAEAEALLHFGRRNHMGKSIAYDQLGSNAREIYFSLSAGYRRVFYNGLIEGNGFGDSSEVLRIPETYLLKLGFDFNHRFDRNDYKVGIRYHSSETITSDSHLFVQLSYALSW